VYKAKYAHQAWDEEGIIVSSGKGNAASLEQYAQIYWDHLKKGAYDEETGEYVDPETCGWTVWLNEDNSVYLEFAGSRFVAKGGNVEIPELEAIK
jgi:hypothetical protein